ncbi:hypothetical protein [Moraxella bovis]|uniref:hypothetical protein n=1 Tax=Moraxella bovis TaxID=476 RepID=UPI002226CF60|nr:hypothetical protein [Moraxella bovis]UZA57384.1 hypothetical protein LP127_01530 [Moraxella bovis]
MARNDIRFGQAQQADFGQANQMFRISQEQLDNALATGKRTLDEINKAVTANNDAKIKQFINSFGKAELEANRDTINEFIQDIGLQSGNMYSRNEMEEYHDNRMSDLIARDNVQMLNTEKNLQHENTLAKHDADSFVAGITPYLNDPTKTEAQKLQIIDNMIAEAKQAGISDKTLAYVSSGAFDGWGKSIDGQLDRLTGANQIADGYLKQIVGMFEPLATKVVNAQTHLDNVVASRDSYPNAQAYDQAVAKATQALQTSQTNAHGFMRANESKIPMGMQMDRFNNNVAGILEQREKAKQQAHKMDMEIAEYYRKMNKDKHDFTLGNRKVDIEQQNANQTGAYQQGQLDLGGAKLSAEIKGLIGGGSGSGKGNGGSTKLTKDNPNYETLTKLGIKEDGSYDAKEFANKYASSMQALKTKTETQNNAVKYNDWIMNEGASYAKAIHDNNGWFENNLSEIQDTFPKGASEYEKIEIVKAYATNPKYSINAKNTAILANNAKIRLGENIRAEHHKEFANILQAMSSIHPDVTAESLTVLLVEQGNLPTDILATIPVEYLNSYNALKKASNVSKPKSSNFDKTVKSLFERKESGDGTLLKDPKKRNMGDGRGTMLIDPNAPKPPAKTFKKETRTVNKSLPVETNKVPYRGASMGKFFYPNKY